MPNAAKAVAVVALAGAAALFSDMPAWPQAAGPSAQTTVGTVTVQGGPAASEEMIRTVIAPFVEQHAARDRKTGLLVRAPPTGLCPITLGLPPAFDDFVTARVRVVAQRVGARIEPAGR